MISCMDRYIFADNTLKVFSLQDVIKRLEWISQDTSFMKAIEKSKKNWLGLSVGKVLEENLNYFRSLGSLAR